METAWRELRARLNETVPTGREGRAAFLGRLRRAVAWVNDHRGDLLMGLCTNQKVRATEIRKLHGAKCRF